MIPSTPIYTHLEVQGGGLMGEGHRGTFCSEDAGGGNAL